jgi:hypothetical protein
MNPEYKIEKYQFKYRNSPDENKKQLYSQKINYYNSLIEGGLITSDKFKGKQLNEGDKVCRNIDKLPLDVVSILGSRTSTQHESTRYRVKNKQNPSFITTRSQLEPCQQEKTLPKNPII